MKNFLLRGHEIVFDDDFCRANEIFSTFHIRSWDCFEAFLEELHKYSDLDTVMNNLSDLTTCQIFTCVHEAVKKIVGMGIMTYSEDDFVKEYNDKIFSIIDSAYNDIMQRYDEILHNEEQKKLYRQYQRSSRSKWVGGGFGLSGAINGAIDAGILNAITGAFRFVGDTVVDLADGCGSMINKSNFKSSDIFNTYAHYVRIACESVGYALYDKLMDLGELNPIKIESKEVNSIISNLKSYSSSKTEKIDLLVSCITKNPYNYEIYELLFELLGYNDKRVAEIACFFGFRYEVQNNFYVNVSNTLNNLLSMPQDAPKECEEKYNALKKYLTNIGFINSNGTWDKDCIEIFGCKDEANYLHTELDKLKTTSTSVNGTSFNSVSDAQNRYDEIKAYEQRKRNEEIAKEEIKETAGKGIGCIIVLAILGVIIWGCFKLSPIVFEMLFEPSHTSTTSSSAQSSTANSSSAVPDKATTSSGTQNSPINSNEEKYFKNTCVINYHRWFGGDIIKQDTGSYVNSNETYTRYIYSYDNDSYPKQYSDLLIKDGCIRIKNETVTEDGEKITTETYAKEDYNIFGIKNEYTIIVMIYHDRKNILIVAPDKK